MFETVRCGPQSFIQAVIAMFAPDGSTDLRDIARRSFCGRGQGAVEAQPRKGRASFPCIEPPYIKPRAAGRALSSLNS